MSNKEAEETLRVCRTSLKENEGIVDRNKKKVEYYQTVAYPLYEQKYNEWNNRKTQFEQQYKKWENKIEEYEKWNNILSSMDKTFNIDLGWYGCNGLVNNGDANWQCSNKANNDALYDGSGFYSYDDYTTGGVGPCRWRGIRCSRTQESKNKITNDYNSLKPYFTEQQPLPPDDPQKILEKTIPITCCANIYQSFGSDITNSDANQKCASELNNQEKTLDISNSITNSLFEQYKLYIIIGVSILLICLSCSSSLSILF